jgi:hypothetical protein
MSSKFESILDAIAAELTQFGFKTVAKGWTFDRARALPACLVAPIAKENAPWSHFADAAKYRVALLVEIAERDHAQLVSKTLEFVEALQSHFHHRLLGSVPGHVDTQAQITALAARGDDKPQAGSAAPSVELTLQVIEELAAT